MPSGCKILLKARPTPAQMSDRLAEPVPDGLELYLDAADISDEGWLERLVKVALEHRPNEGFDYVVEGPVRSLDGTFFSISNGTEANVEVVRRLVLAGRKVGAKALVIHAIAPRAAAKDFNREVRRGALVNALPFLEFYSRQCRYVNLVPTLENVPPVARMRENKWVFTPIGMGPEDLMFLCGETEGLQLTLDVSHAQLYINAIHASVERVGARLKPLVSYLQQADDVRDLNHYIARVEDRLFEAHISNAKGITGEGLPYAEGELDLDEVARRLARRARYLVTETIEPNPERAGHMREAQDRLRAALSALQPVPAER